MRFGISVALAIFAFVGLSSVSQAADMSRKAPLYVNTQQNWTGFYVGLFGGYHDGDITQQGCVGLCPVNPTLKGRLIWNPSPAPTIQFNNKRCVPDPSACCRSRVPGAPPRWDRV